MDPRAQYQSRLDRRRAFVAQAAVREDRWSSLRLVIFLGLAALVVYRLNGHAIANGLWLLPAVLFLLAWANHHRVREALRQARFAVIYFEQGLARLDDRWAGTGPTGLTYLEPQHPYALDLDLFGVGSLFQRLCTAQTSAGEKLLASWLCQPAEASEIRERQQAIQEMRDRIDWRETLAMLGHDARGLLEVDALLRWASAPAIVFASWASASAWILSTATVVGVGMWFAGRGPFLLIAAAIGQAFFYGRYHRQVASVVQDVGSPVQELDMLARLLHIWEKETWRSDSLKALSLRLNIQGVSPSQRIRALSRLVDLLDSRRNQLFAPIAAIIMWDALLAFALEKWRRQAGPLVAQWLAAAARLEALSAIAAYTFENPLDPFASFVDEKGAFRARELGHPLLPRAACICNDVDLGATRLLLVSGSNMSGKSTLLRAIGINAVLAQLGAPVRAASLEMSELAIGATLRVQDDLRAGTSRFYAEILRLRIVTDLTRGKRPVLFLLDEILHGTNSHDRVSGAQAILRGLVSRGALGAVTTHDLALTQLTLDATVRARNVFFADHFEDGQMRFDYRMREGVITHSNALELMRAVGLDID